MSDTTSDEIAAIQAARKQQQAIHPSLLPDAESAPDADETRVKKKKKSSRFDVSLDVSTRTQDGDEHMMTRDDDDSSAPDQPTRLLDSFTAPQHLLHEFADDSEQTDPFAETAKSRQISARQSDYHQRRFERQAGTSADAFAGDAGDTEGESYEDKMRRAELEREEQRVRREIERRQQEGTDENGQPLVAGDVAPDETPKGRRWDVEDVPDRPTSAGQASLEIGQERGGEWDESKLKGKEAEKKVEEAPRRKRSRWDETPTGVPSGATGAAPGETPKRSRWDQTPAGVSGGIPKLGGQFGMTPVAGASGQVQINTVAAGTSGEGFLLIGGVMDKRVRILSDEELDQMLPQEGYEIVTPPAGYAPIRTPARKLTETPMAANGGGFMMQAEGGVSAEALGISQDLPTDIEGVGDLQFFKKEDAQYFAKILTKDDETELSVEELKERKIMRLLLKIKNGTPPMRKSALRQITDKARDFGAGPLFDKILPLLMERTLEDQERHLLVKVIDRVLYKLDDLVRPYVHKILVVIEPLLIDEDYYARVEGREIISNLSKAAGLAHMISTMRPDIDHADEYVRNTTARAFSVVASALGIPSLLPFLKAVCRSKKSWQARHTGIKIIQQIAIMMGCAVLPHLKNLVESVAHGLEDDQQKVRTMTALCIAALAEAAAPYGIESFDSVLKPLWTGIRKHRGKGLAAFLKAIGFIIPLMDPEYANYYTREVMVILIREFQSPDEEMKKIVLKVVKQCAATDGVQPAYVRDEILPEFFKNFLVRRMALDRRNYRQVVETTVELANKAGVSEIVGRIVNDLKDESEPYRKMCMEIITKVVGKLGAADIDERLEVQLIDGIIYAFQEQTVEDNVMLEGFGTVVTALGIRVKPYLTQIVSTILWRLNNKSAKVRQQAADLTAKLALVIKQCEEDALLNKLGVVLFEQLGEEYPDTLGSIISAIAAIANVVGMTQMSPPVKDLLPRMTPILRNRHEKVQEASINLIGRIADRGAEFVSAREWMRICFELLDLLKAHKRAIRRAAVNSFGYIAKAIGPQDVLSVLLTNLKVQDRQSRVCSTVAIAIVAETCGPFTCIPAILNEYRTPELNVRNGCLKAMSFLFEYIGEMGKDYIHSVVTCLEDALTDRDQVHRQTAASIVKHLALGTAGLGAEDANLHLMNLIWPNIFETSPHVINSVLDAIEAMRVALGPGVVLAHVLQGLFHPARKVREVYWQVYNSLYMGAQDALVAYYPSLELSDERNYYERDVMFQWI
ncbi:U2 snRNP complex subunit HSH155 [Sporobolomyces koalae]|uniref:U2 snRNP complex subunit HSH155 n=1 Tax=Sporobolomyces koalae TaxID=500713 RepID=UPI003177B24A